MKTHSKGRYCPFYDLGKCLIQMVLQAKYCEPLKPKYEVAFQNRK